MAAYFDLSFQHASHPVLRRMRRFGDPESFLGLLEQAPPSGAGAGRALQLHRRASPARPRRTSSILCDFLTEARLDAIGIFGYSDEDGTEAEGFDDKLDEDEIRERVEHVTALAEELTAQRAEERIGEEVVVLVESLRRPTTALVVEGRAAHQGPEVDGTTTLERLDGPVSVGDMIAGTGGRHRRCRPRRPPTVGGSVDHEAGGPMSEQRREPSNWNVPNALTTLRIVMVPFFGVGAAARRRSTTSPGAGSRGRCSWSR